MAKVRFSETLRNFGTALGQLETEARDEVRAAFDRLVDKCGDQQGRPDGGAFATGFSRELLAALPPTVQAIGGVLEQRMRDEISHRGPEWTKLHLVQSFRNFVPAFDDSMPQRASAASSPLRASTQRASPPGVCSFFQNGACVLR